LSLSSSGIPSKNPEDADPGEDGALGVTIANAY